MKIISFYSEKGGVGKSVHSVLFASWLQYHEGKRVCVFDLEPVNYRLGQQREEEEYFLQKEPESPLSRYYAKTGIQEKDWYPIIPFGQGRDQSSLEKVVALKEEFCLFVEEHKEEYDYVVVDFHPIFTFNSLDFHLLKSGLFDLVVVPVLTDNSSRSCAFNTAMNLKHNRQNVVLFWNHISVSDISRRGYLDAGEGAFAQNGLEFLPYRIKTFAKAGRDSDGKLFVKSTVCWPERYVEMACPELPKLYQEIKNRLDRM